MTTHIGKLDLIAYLAGSLPDLPAVEEFVQHAGMKPPKARVERAPESVPPLGDELLEASESGVGHVEPEVAWPAGVGAR
jgi:hypothetical protein